MEQTVCRFILSCNKKHIMSLVAFIEGLKKGAPSAAFFRPLFDRWQPLFPVADSFYGGSSEIPRRKAVFLPEHVRKLGAVRKATAHGNLGHGQIFLLKQDTCGGKTLFDQQLLRRDAVGLPEKTAKIIIAEAGFRCKRPEIQSIRVVKANEMINAFQSVPILTFFGCGTGEIDQKNVQQVQGFFAVSERLRADFLIKLHGVLLYRADFRDKDQVLPGVKGDSVADEIDTDQFTSAIVIGFVMRHMRRDERNGMWGEAMLGSVDGCCACSAEIYNYFITGVTVRLCVMG